MKRIFAYIMLYKKIKKLKPKYQDFLSVADIKDIFLNLE